MSSAEEKARLQACVFEQLMLEVEHGAPAARLSTRLRVALERMSPAERRALVSREGAGGRAPLLAAAARGNAEAVEYLVHVCGAPLEQRGACGAHRVTPLWAAAVGGRLAALRALADAGAALDARSDSGSTPLRSACFMSRAAAVRFLCERGADVAARNHRGGTALINAVQCARLTRYLLARGAPPDAQDAHGHTALHYAVQEQRAETVRALLAAGADPRVAALSGEDALTAAAARGGPALVALLAAGFPRARLADAHELLGASQLDELDDAAAALASWRRATDIRLAEGEYVEKAPAAACEALRGAREWRGRAELEALAGDGDAVRAQALLVARRVLGPAHPDTLFRFMHRGAWYADGGRWRRAAELWSGALAERLRAHTLLHTDTCHTLYALTRLLGELAAGAGASAGERAAPDEGWERGAAGSAPPLDVVLHAVRLVAAALPEGARLMAVRPWCARQAEAWERALRCLVQLAALAAAAAGDRPRALLEDFAALVAADPRTHGGGETLLHAACAATAGDGAARARLARLLLAAGAAPLAADRAGRHPLHVALLPYNYSPELVEVLLGGGAHACAPDARGESALRLAAGAARRQLQRRDTLACRAARAAPPLAPPHALPATLQRFLRLHRAPPPRTDEG